MKSHKNLEKIIRKFDFDFLEHQTWSSKYITFVRLQSIGASKIQTDKRREQKKQMSRRHENNNAYTKLSKIRWLFIYS